MNASSKEPIMLEIEGLEEIIDTFRRYFSDIDTSPIIARAMKKIGMNIKASAQEQLQLKIYNIEPPESQTYERTGLLKANIAVDVPKQTNTEIGLFVRAKQHYAAAVELQKKNPRPFLRPAGQIEHKKSMQIMDEALLEFLQTKVKL